MDSNLDKSDDDMFINIFKSWKTCLDNHITITDIKYDNKVNVSINDNIYINDIETYKNISKTSSIFISNCNNLDIFLSKKINHIIIENCINVNLEVASGIISGIDVLHSENINIIITNEDIFYLSFGEVLKSYIYIDKSLALNTLINTLHCNTTNFILINGILDKVKYLTNTSLFSGFNMMMFIYNDDTSTFELHYFNQNSKGIIYPS